MVKKFTINVFDFIPETKENEIAFDLKKVKIAKIDKFTGDIILEVEYTEDKS